MSAQARKLIEAGGLQIHEGCAMLLIALETAGATNVDPSVEKLLAATMEVRDTRGLHPFRLTVV
jgi:hypothetical protein